MLYDPIVFIVLMAGSGYSVVFILYLNGLIKGYYFYSFLATQSAFFIGFLCNRRPSFKKINLSGQGRRPYYGGTIKILYPASIFLFMSSQLFIYYQSGIPLFFASRLAIFSGGDGYGIFNRIIFVTQIASCAIAFYRLFFVERKGFSVIVDYFVIVFCLVAAILSGAKASILLMVFSMFYVLLFVNKFDVERTIYKKIKRFFLIFLSLGVMAALITISYQTNSDNFSYLFSVLAMRFVNTGDIYFMSYINGTLEQLMPANFFLALFKDFFGAFRLVDWANLPTNLGLQIFWSVYDSNQIQGPNPRHNVFGLFYLGPYLSIFYSFIVGFSVSYIRNKMLMKLSASPASMIFYVLIAANTLYIEQDTTFALGQYLSICIVFIPLWVLSRLTMQMFQMDKGHAQDVKND
ncbi:hypothetical protein J2125_000660 [Erwinia toletana]|uniref:Oligosaccharide repeat unit polymerase n=1 Tax=Winslowiella toletana TaxID=92490 RepID=A0ABS4P486_9GAMM|nr:O-antigen polymerase [Winslowiella toletana]MBP2167468.1 hypothetical protein [Winslowiella toletana]